jgi:hypothetical protein
MWSILICTCAVNKIKPGDTNMLLTYDDGHAGYGLGQVKDKAVLNA